VNDQLSLYNRTLTEYLGERKLASLTENRESRRVMDEVYPNAIKACLEQGQWKFALRSSMLTYSPSVEPSFGYPRAFEKPTDVVRVVKFCADEFFREPLLDYIEEAGWWYANLDDIYVTYVSNHANFGMDYSHWPESYVDYLCLYMAVKAAPRIAQAKNDVNDLEKRMEKARKNALSKDALQGPTVFPPRGNWVRARSGRGSGERGNGGQLIG